MPCRLPTQTVYTSTIHFVCLVIKNVGTKEGGNSIPPKTKNNHKNLCLTFYMRNNLCPNNALLTFKSFLLLFSISILLVLVTVHKKHTEKNNGCSFYSVTDHDA